ncbi:MAG: glycosyltransferase family 4 protein [Candidatus Margulisbacteria bacterium]|nr:glycosyltransferase family 4 protein [Candidatus Margulisiibacteriota bacterium]
MKKNIKQKHALNCKIKVNIFAESFIGEANGVLTAVKQTIQALTHHKEVEVQFNGKKQADILHSHTIGPFFLLKSLEKSHKTIISAHVIPDSFIGSLIFSKWWKPLAKVYLRFIYNQADTIIAVSPKVKVELQKIGIKRNIEVLCNGVDRKKFKPDETARKKIRKNYNIPLKKTVVLCVGQLQPRKGLEDFIACARLLPDLIFLWAGGRPYGRLTEQYSKMNKLINTAPKNIIFTGIIAFDEIPYIYAAADIYFMPSYQENFAYATIEAASVKLPLVTRDIPEYLDTLFNHYLKGTTVQEFCLCIRRLTEDKSCYQKYQHHSDILAEKYNLNIYGDKLINIYKNVLEECSQAELAENVV